MIIFDFITPEEIDELPDDDPRAAFTMFVRIAVRRLGEQIAQLDSSDARDWDTINEARHGFMNVVVAAAKKYQIEPIASLAVPPIAKFGVEDNRQFRADLDHYLTQLVLDNNTHARRDSVLIPADLKTTIRTYVFHLRELIEKGDGIDEKTRQILLRRLAEFESELENKRLNLIAVAALAITLISAPGAAWSSMDAVNKLVTNILRVVGDAKSADDATRRLAPPDAPMAITGPRPGESKNASKSDMDDEIPF